MTKSIFPILVLINLLQISSALGRTSGSSKPFINEYGSENFLGHTFHDVEVAIPKNFKQRLVLYHVDGRSSKRTFKTAVSTRRASTKMYMGWKFIHVQYAAPAKSGNKYGIILASYWNKKVYEFISQAGVIKVNWVDDGIGKLKSKNLPVVQYPNRRHLYTAQRIGCGNPSRKGSFRWTTRFKATLGKINKHQRFYCSWRKK